MADTYNIAIKRAQDPGFGPLITGLTSPHYTFTNLLPNTNYVYETSVTTPRGVSPYAIGSFKTLPDASAPSPPPSIPPGPPQATPPPVAPPPGGPPVTPPPGGPPSPPNAGPPVTPPPVGPPSASGYRPSVQNMSISGTGNQLILQWDAPVGHTVNRTVNYIVRYKLASDFNWTLMPVFTSAVAVAITYTLTLAFNSKYHLQISADNSRYSVPFIWTTDSNGPTDSPDGTVLSLTSGSIIGSDGGIYTLVTDTTLPLKIHINGSADTTASEAICMAYIGQKVYHQNKSYSWFRKVRSSDPWVLVADPRSGAPPVSIGITTYNILSTSATAVITWNSSFTLNGPDVTLLFWGSYWNETTTPSANSIVDSVRNTYASPYFSGLQEYAIFKRPTIIASIIIPGNPPNLSSADVSTDQTFPNFLTGLFDARTLIPSLSDNHLYLIITPPATMNYPNVTGAHSYLTYQGILYHFSYAFYFPNGKPTVLQTFQDSILEQTVLAMTDPYVGSGIRGWAGLTGELFGPFS